MPSVPFKVRATFDYTSDEPDDLNFKIGDIITVTDDDDADWYTGQYTTAAGDKAEGMFPRNFVEKYEPAIPSRPARAPKRAPAPELPDPTPEPPPPPPQAVPAPIDQYHDDDDTAKETEPLPLPAAAASVAAGKPAAAPPASVASKPSPTTASKGPPPVAEKPNTSSFKDRIAAFNKPAAAPVTPFKPSGNASTGFIKKPFVAPPPSRNAFVPPPRDQSAPKPIRRDEDLPVTDTAAGEAPEPLAPSPEAVADDQPKPQSLKDRIALLQKQQLEQAARSAEKKDKPKKPAKKRQDTTEEAAPLDPSSEPIDTAGGHAHALGPDVRDVEHDLPRSPPPRRPTDIATVTPQPQPSRELVSDTNDADDSGAADDEDAPEMSTEEERPKSGAADLAMSEVPRKAPADEDRAVEEHDQHDEEDEEEDEDEEEEEDPEVQRRRELRERMAKMSGGMGMMGMFGGPGAMALPPSKKPKAAPANRQPSEGAPPEEPVERAAPVRIMALPGMSTAAAPKRVEEPAPADDSDEDETARPTPQEPPLHDEADDYVSRPIQRRSTDRAPPPLPHERPPPPAPPRDARAAPPPPPAGSGRNVPPLPQSPTSRPVPPPPPTIPTGRDAAANYTGLEEGDADEHGTQPTATADTPTGPPMNPPLLATKQEPPKLDTFEGTSPTSEKRASRPPPPVPMSPVAVSSQSRPPPPPPPGAPPSRRSTTDSRLSGTVQSPAADDSDEEEVTEYDGDYDTDIASGAKHKDALKSHNRDSSLDEGMLTDDALKAPKSPPVRAAPPVPPVTGPTGVPPPPPVQSSPRTRKSVDVPRGAPPPVPQPKVPDEDEYDPYRYTAAPSVPPPNIPAPPAKGQYTTVLQSPREDLEDEDLYGATPQPTAVPHPPMDRSAPLPPPPPTSADRAEIAGSMPHVGEMKRSNTGPRRSVDNTRTSGEQGYMAHDLDLGRGSLWWTRDDTPPPSLQGRSDIFYETESSSSTKRGGKMQVSRDVYILYMDYSQTTVNATFDAADPSHVTLEQSHERPPPAPRRDQLEHASEQFGAQIARVASTFVGGSAGDGSAPTFILELLKPHVTALKPIGTRAYGALVYANLGNASTQQYDEIRAGDIVTFRNAKFAGHKGGLHQKYSVDVGKPEHVAVVIDWDGTKKKIRAWEQGRDLEKGKKPKVREESFKVGDLKSGEVMVWRIMPRSWVGWDKS